MKRLLLAPVGAAVVLALGLTGASRVPAAEPAPGKADIYTLIAGWKKAVQKKIARDPELKALAAKYPLVVLCSRRYQTRDNRPPCSYSFIQDPSDKTAKGSAHVLYDNGAADNTFSINFVVSQQNLVADLGMVDFTKDLDPRQVNINGGGENTWLPWCSAVPGHVYLERVRDWEGHLFYVVFKVVAADEKQSRYAAFLWRRLPDPLGGKLPKPVDPYPAHRQPPLSDEEKAKVNERMVEWEKATRAKMARNPKLRTLAAKYRLVVLHDRDYTDDYGRSAYSFIHGSSNENVHLNHVQILFESLGTRADFDVNMTTDQQNLVADLGTVDFTQDADPLRVDINGQGQYTWFPDNCAAVEGHVYLERVKNIYGTRFYVMFQVVAMEPGRYMAFVWRRLPGGKVVQPPEPVPASAIK